MKQHKLPGRQSQAYTILSLIAVSGELPVGQIKRLPGGDEYKIKLIKTLKQKKFITTYYRDKLRGHRLTNTAKEMLLTDNGERFTFSLTGNSETNLLKSEITRRLRLHSIAETLVTMHNAGVAIYRDDKPDIFSPDNTKDSLSVTAPVFYNSREMKNYGADFDNIRGARSVGVLLSESKIFAAYNTRGSGMKWSYKAEIKTKTLLEGILSIECMPRQYFGRKIRGLMFGDSMEQLYELFTSTGGSKKRSFTLDDTYENFLYLPNDANGEMVLWLICDDEKTQELNYMLSQDYNERQIGMRVINDAVDENGDPVLFAYDCDMARIDKFNGGVDMFNGMKGTLYCFDFQADVLRRYCCDNITIETIKTDKFKKRFYPDGS